MGHGASVSGSAPPASSYYEVTDEASDGLNEPQGEPWFLILNS